MCVLGAEGVVTCVWSEKTGIGGREGVVEGELDGGRGSAAIATRDSAFVKGGWFTVRANDGLPIAGVLVLEVVIVLPVAKELGFGCDKGGGRDWESKKLVFLRKGIDPCHARESRPLDGVPIGVSVVEGVGIEESCK